MTSLRLLAGVFYACGLLSFLLGLEGISRAQSCTEVVWTSAECAAAHPSAPFENDSGSYCEWVGSGCQTTASSSCVDRWGLVIAGDCIPEGFGTTDTYTCYEGSFATLINVSWYTADCEHANGNCRCAWSLTGTWSTAQVCDCYDVENQF